MVSLNKKYFTLIEIVFALGIIVVALAAILPLLTVGMRSSKDSISNNYVADTAEQFLHYMAQECKKDWDGHLGSSGTISASEPSTSEQDIANWTTITETNLYSTTDAAIFGIKQGSTNITDFTAVIRVWKSTVTSQVFSGSGWDEKTDTNYDYSAGLNIEISWPAEIPYDQREKKYFYLEIFKPN